MTDKISRYLGDREFWGSTLRLAVPISLQNLLACSFSLIDTLMIGRLGDIALSAVGMAGQWSWLLGLFLFGFYSGSSVFFAQYWGSGELLLIRRIAGIMFLHMIIISSVFTLAGVIAPSLILRLFNDTQEVIELGSDYIRIASWSYLAMGLSNGMSALLRSTERVRLPMIASTVSALTNVLLNWLLIFGNLGFPAMGVRGAAAATTISAWIGPILMFFVSLRQKNIMVTDTAEMLRFDKRLIKKFYKISLPVALNESLWGLGTMIYNVIFAHLGYEEFAAVTIERTIEGIAFSAGVGLCTAASVMIGKSIGAGETEQGVCDARRFLINIPLSSAIISAAVIFLRPSIIGLFSGGISAAAISQHTTECAMQIMLIYFIEFPLRMIQYILIVGVFRSGGDTRTGMIYDLISVWLIAIPVMMITAFLLKWPLWKVYISMLIAEDWLKAVACIRHFRSGKWIKPVTSHKRDILG